MKSKKFTLNETDYENQLKSAIEWLIPLALLYLTQLQGTLQLNNGLSIKDFMPTAVTIGGMELYIVNQFYGLFSKWRDEK